MFSFDSRGFLIKKEMSLGYHIKLTVHWWVSDSVALEILEELLRRHYFQVHIDPELLQLLASYLRVH